MILRPVLVFIIAFCSISSYCQSLFEFDYQFDIDNNREHYNAFMLRNDDGTGFMRVRYQDVATKSWILVELQMQEHYMGDEDPNDKNKTDSSILVFEGFNPEVITGPAGLAYDPDVFIFQYNDQTGNYEPLSVISEDENHKEYEGTINEVKLLNESDLTKEKVSLYFTEKDELFQNLFQEAQVRTVSPQMRLTELFLVIVANTDDLSIGNTCVVDKDATLKTFSAIADFLGIKYTPIVISGKDFKKTNVDIALNNLNPGKNDIVVFYYSGHGFSNMKDSYRFPYLDLRDKVSQNFGGQYAINMEDIFGKIKAKGARLNLVISDCCNADPSLTNSVTGDLASTRHSSVGWNLDNCRALFMNEKPLSLLMTAAQKGELSAGNSMGGIFTFNFRETMEKSFGPFYGLTTWSNLLKTSQTQTTIQANKTNCIQQDNSRRRCVQNPVFKME